MKFVEKAEYEKIGKEIMNGSGAMKIKVRETPIEIEKEFNRIKSYINHYILYHVSKISCDIPYASMLKIKDKKRCFHFN